MEGGLDLLGGVGGGGEGGASLGDSTNGSSSSTVSKAGVVVEQDFVGLSSEVSSYPAEADLELGLGLSLGGAVKAKPLIWGEYGRILTANDFPSLVSRGSPASSSSSSGRANASCVVAGAGTKRAADSIAQEEGSVHGVSQVVGWPPIRAYRMNSLVNQTKVPDSKEGDNMVFENSKNKDNVKKTTINNNGNKVQEKVHLGNSLLVKVNMDGVPIGRKVDLNVHACYETLSQILEDMFHTPNTNSICLSREREHGVEAAKPSKLLDGSSEFVLTYEDKEGDLMLVGDVPWGMFLNTVKRLRIMRTSEANGLAPRFQDNCRRQRTKPT